MALFGKIGNRFDDLKKAVVKDTSPRQYLTTAEEFRKAGKFREAIQTLEAGIQQNPGYVAVYVALGRLCQQTDWLDDGIKAYQNALKLDRENLVAIRGLADCYFKKGDKVEAIKKYKLFRGLKPGDKDVQILIEQLDAELNPPRPKSAPRVETWPSIPIVKPAATPSVPPRPSGEFARPTTPSGEFARPVAPPSPPVPPPAPPPETTNPIAVASAVPPPEPPPVFSEAIVAERDASTGPVSPEPPPEDKYHATDVLELTFDGLSAKRSAKPIPPALPVEPRPLAGVPMPEPEAMAPPTPPPLPTPPPAPPAPVDVFEAPAPRVAAHEPPPIPPGFLESSLDISRPVAMRAPEPESAPFEPAPAPPPLAAPEAPLPVASAPPPAAAERVADPFEEATLPPVGAEQAAVSETLAELYLAQGYREDAKQTYEALATSEPTRAEELLAKARDLTAAAAASVEATLPTPVPAAAAPTKSESPKLRKLRALAHGAAAEAVEISDMHAVLEALVGRTPGIPAAVLTDLEGLPVVHAGERFSSSTMETLIAELTAFWKGLGRSREELGAGGAKCLMLRGENGGALVKAVSPEYSLILHLESDASLGRVLFEAGRAARLVRPALG